MMKLGAALHGDSHRLPPSTPSSFAERAGLCRFTQIAPATDFDLALEGITLIIRASSEPIFSPTPIWANCLPLWETDEPEIARIYSSRCWPVPEPGELVAAHLHGILVGLSAGAIAATPYGSVLAGPSNVQQGLTTTSVPELAPPRAYLAFKDLANWLSADEAEIADMVGIGRTTPYAWHRDGREPRPSTVRRLYEYHATLDALRRKLGEKGMQQWLELGRRDTLLAGDLEAVGDDVRQALFLPAQRWFDLAAAPEPTEERAQPRYPAQERVRRVRRAQPRRGRGR